jgi:hypothetical protein
LNLTRDTRSGWNISSVSIRVQSKNGRLQSKSVGAVALLTVSRFRIARGVVRISARMVGILLNSCFQRQNSNESQLSLRAYIERDDDESPNELRQPQSELFAEHTVLRRMQGAISYKFRTELGVNNEVKGNLCK